MRATLPHKAVILIKAYRAVVSTKAKGCFVA